MASQNHRQRRRSQPEWAAAKDSQLLDMRFCDLRLKIDRSPIEESVEQLYEELAERGLRLRPHCWFSEEWFSPDGVPGIAIPFYLAHPRLMRLERRQMYEVEGSTKTWCIKILRHEAGHALDTAFRLSRRSGYRQVFGRRSQRYPDYYRPKPFSRKYVLHLDRWYAQSHPVEDFAETFAVWLKPGSRWRSKYKDWPALSKLEYVDELMADIQKTTPPVRKRVQVDPLSKIRYTLREHYQHKREHYGVDQPCFYDDELRKLFAETENGERTVTAAAFLNRLRPEMRKVISTYTGEYQYTVDQILSEMIARCREMNLRLDRSERETKRDAMVMLTVQIMNYLHGGYHRLAL